MKYQKNTTNLVYFCGFMLLFAFTLSTCTHKKSPTGKLQIGIKIDKGWVRAMPPVAKNSAAYMKINNHNNYEDRLLSVSSSISERAETHNIIRMGDMFSMRQVKHIIIPARGSIELKPGGLHIMLFKLNKILKDGDKIKMVLHFEKMGQISIFLPVKEGVGMGSSQHNMNHSNPQKMMKDPMNHMKKGPHDNGTQPMKTMDHHM